MSAAEPTAVLLSAVPFPLKSLNSSAKAPRAVFAPPSMLELSALEPTAVLSMARTFPLESLNWRAIAPTAVLSKALRLDLSVPEPIAVLLLAPPLPVVSLFASAPDRSKFSRGPGMWTLHCSERRSKTSYLR